METHTHTLTHIKQINNLGTKTTRGQYYWCSDYK